MASPAANPLVNDPPPTPAGLTESAALQLEKDIIEWTGKLYETATGERDYEKETNETFKLISYLEGKQWADSARRARHRPVLNKVSRHFWDSVGLLTDLSLDFQV